MYWIWIWVAVVAVSLIVEFITMEMVSLWTAIGGLIALILSALGAQYEIQLVVFFVVSIALLLSLRKISIKYLLKNSESKSIGNNALIGSTHTLISGISKDTLGSIKINGVVWSVASNEEIPAGSEVIIKEIKGNKFIVQKKENN